MAGKARIYIELRPSLLHLKLCGREMDHALETAVRRVVDLSTLGDTSRQTPCFSPSSGPRFGLTAEPPFSVMRIDHGL